MASSDGSITFSTELDNSGLEDGIKQADKEIEDLKRKVGAAKASGSTSDLAEYYKQLKEAYEKYQSLMAQGAMASAQPSSEEAVRAATSARDRILDALRSVAAGAKGAFSTFGSAVSSVTKGLWELGRTLSTAVLGVALAGVGLAFSMFIGGVMEGVREVLAGNEELRQSTATLAAVFGGFVSYAASAIAQVLVPILTGAVRVATAALMMLARFIDSVFGTNIVGAIADSMNAAAAGSESAAAAADGQARSTRKLAKATKEANRQLMGFDELNVLNVQGDTPDYEIPDYGPVATPDVEAAKPAGVLAEGLEEIEGILGRIAPLVAAVGAALLAWRLSSGFMDFFKKFGGILAAVAGAAMLAYNWFDAWNNGVDWQNLLGMLGGVALMAGGLLVAFGKVGGAIGLVVGGVALLSAGFKDFLEKGPTPENTASVVAGIMLIGGAVALLTGSWIPLAIAAVVGLIAALVMNWESVSAYLEGVFGDMSRWFHENMGPLAAWADQYVVAPLKQFFGTLKQFFGELWDAIVAATKGDWGPLAGWTDKWVVQPIMGFWNGLKRFFDELWSAVISATKGDFGPLAGWFSAYVVQPVMKFFEPFLAFFSALWDTIVRNTEGIWRPVARWFSDNVINPVRNFFQGAWNAITGFFSNSKASVQGIWGPVSTWFSNNVITPVRNFFQGAWNAITGFVKGAWSNISNVWRTVSTWFNNTVLTPLKNFFSNAWGVITNIPKDAWNRINAVWKAVSAWFNNTVLTPLKNIFSTTWGAVTGFVKDAWTKISNVWKAVSTWFNNTVLTPVKNFFSNAWGVVANIPKDAWNRINAVWKAVSTWFNNTVLTPVKNIFSNAWNAISGTVTGVWTAVKRVWDNAGTWFNGTVLGPLKNAFSKAWDALKDGAGKAWSGIKTVFSNVAQFFKDVFSKGWSGILKIFQFGGSIFTGVVDAIKNAFKVVANNIISGMNWAIAQPLNGINDIFNSMRNWEVFGQYIFSWLPSIAVPQIPYLAQGAVIPANREFLAVLGDQSSGRNLEAPEGLIRQIVREEAGNAGLESVLLQILDAVRNGKEIWMDGEKVGGMVSGYQASMQRVNGW